MTDKADDIRRTLDGFYGGDTIYRHPLFRRYLYTEGVQYLAQAAGAYWLLDNIFAKQTGDVAREEFQVWKLTVTGSTGLLTCEDGNEREVHREVITFTDFPLPEITLWFEGGFEGGTLMLPSER